MDIIEHRDTHGITMAINRSLDLTNAGDLDKALRLHFADGKAIPIWIDVGMVQSIDSAGLTLFLKWHRHSLATGRRLAIVGTKDFHRKLFEITRLDQEVLIYDAPGGRRIPPTFGRVEQRRGILEELEIVL